MKKVLLLSILVTCVISISKAQIDYCKEVQKKIDETNGNTKYYNPSMSRLDKLGVQKVITSNGYALLSLSFATTQNIAIYDASGIFIKFDDGSTVNFHEDVLCSYLNAEDHYLYNTGYLIDDDKDLAPFKTKKIIKFTIAGKEVLVSDDYATKFMAWVNCIDAIKK